jgi:SAM-dependent methyltransferase
MERVRWYHNWVKERMLENAVQIAPSRVAPKLLDLACRPGSDMLKWRRLGLTDVLAWDANKGAIAEARKRYAGLGPGHGVCYRFVIANVCDRLHRYAGTERWSIVTCNMALHYMVRDEERFGLFMDAVAGSLEVGGVFVGTLMNGDRVERLVGPSGKYDSGLMAIARRGKEVSVSMTGTYYFKDGPSQEVLVRPERVIEAALAQGLKLVRWTNFPGYVDVPAGYPPEAAEILALYDVFMFCKRRG